MISRTRIHDRMRRKRNPILAETILLAKKSGNLKLAHKLSGPTKLQLSVNLSELQELKEDKIIVVGRVLGSGDIKRKITVAALGFSKQAKEKLKNAGAEAITIKHEIEKNPKLTGVKII
jgi:large subunit ribosomal protein L18e